MALPSKMKAWQYSSNTKGITPHLILNPSVPVPIPSRLGEMLIRVLSVALNPVDHRPAETVLYRFAIPKPATPGVDFAGEVVQAPADGAFREGDVVFGASGSIFAGGMLAEYAVAESSRVVEVGKITPNEAAAIAIAGLTAYQSIISRVKPNSHILINGGSGGLGTFGIQIAKALGHSVTVSCSGRNAELCRSLGAEVIDYTQGTLLQDLKNAAKVREFDLVVDNVFADPDLYWKAHEYTVRDAEYAVTPINTTYAFMRPFVAMKLLPGLLGGGQRRLTVMFGQPKLEQLVQIRDWIAERKIEVVFDQVVPFEEVKQAFERLTSGRTVGKIIVEVARAPGSSNTQTS
ncbi:uncharacterized protein LTR77_004849 [Saxophila tyrrhenica]|uniref:Enoyl reductase (ER) domain-containing protein n=1 Tax=Saxophila tyrrhenica TaxID=1690608 RepID=A0AAV9PB17_9PEZI|nr:hypothetical protein LTR77_004849 [Saxophila tyrrhenica]